MSMQGDGGLAAIYHLHTDWSDGDNSLDEMTVAAYRHGIREVGFSDHIEAVPSEALGYDKSMSYDGLCSYLDAIDACAECHPDLRIRRGIELEWDPSHLECIRSIVSCNRLDFVLCSVHGIGVFDFESAPEDYSRRTPEERLLLLDGYWDSIRTAAESGICDVIAHCDYVKVSGMIPGDEPWPSIMAALDAIAQNDIAVELNVGGLSAPCRETFPSQRVLRECLRRRIPILLSSDAHNCHDISRNANKGRDMLLRNGCKETVGFKLRGRYPVPLQ